MGLAGVSLKGRQIQSIKLLQYKVPHYLYSFLQFVFKDITHSRSSFHCVNKHNLRMPYFSYPDYTLVALPTLACDSMTKLDMVLYTASANNSDTLSLSLQLSSFH